MLHLRGHVDSCYTCNSIEFYLTKYKAVGVTVSVLYDRCLDGYRPCIYSYLWPNHGVYGGGSGCMVGVMDLWMRTARPGPLGNQTIVCGKSLKPPGNGRINSDKTWDTLHCFILQRSSHSEKLKLIHAC